MGWPTNTFYYKIIIFFLLYWNNLDGSDFWALGKIQHLWADTSFSYVLIKITHLACWFWERKLQSISNCRIAMFVAAQWRVEKWVFGFLKESDTKSNQCMRCSKWSHTRIPKTKTVQNYFTILQITSEFDLIDTKLPLFIGLYGHVEKITRVNLDVFALRDFSSTDVLVLVLVEILA